MGRNIRVTGRGKLSVKPDAICLRIEAEGVYPDYEETIQESTKQTKILRETLEKSGLSGKDLKTLRFSIQTEYERYRDHHDDYKRRSIGYRFKHRAEIRFANDKQQLGRTLYELSHCPVKAEISIHHTVFDPEGVKNELLRKAVSDSREKAKILSEAAGVSLGEIQHIEYAWGEVEIISHPMKKFEMEYKLSETSESYDVDIEAADIDVDDTVTIEWEIR